ncbi:MAG: hypothetical protein ACFBSC_14570 [Microcoleaceae cyanobacterium]
MTINLNPQMPTVETIRELLQLAQRHLENAETQEAKNSIADALVALDRLVPNQFPTQQQSQTTPTMMAYGSEIRTQSLDHNRGAGRRD